VSRDENSKLSSMYRAGAREQPPRWLDERVLAAAARETRPSLAGRVLDALHGWQMPLGLAAVMALTVSLTLTMQAENPELLSGAGVADSQVRLDEEDARASVSRHDLLSGQSDSLRPPAIPARPAPDAIGASGPTASTAAEATAPASQSARSSVDARPSSEATTSHQAEHPRSYKPSSSTSLALAPASPAMPQPPSAAPDERPPATTLSARARAAQRSDEILSDSKAFAAEPSETAPAYEDDPGAWLRQLTEWSNQGREREVREGLRRFLDRYPGHVLPEILQRFR